MDGIAPGLGLLSQEFLEPDIYVWDLSRSRNYATFRRGIKGPTGAILRRPWSGAARGRLFEVTPPGKHGGNMDIRHLTVGSRLMLPVFNEGALFSVCDVHAAQGDGEVCMTAIECPGDVRISFDIVKNGKRTTPCYRTGRVRATRERTGGEFVTTGIAPDLMEATRQAVKSMISYLEGTLGAHTK